MGAYARPMQLRLCLLCAALVASMAMPTTDDVGTIVPEVTQLEEDPTQCFFLRSKEQLSVVGGSPGDGNELIGSLSEMEASSSFSCSERCSDPEVTYSTLQGVQSSSPAAGASDPQGKYLCEGEAPDGNQLAETRCMPASSACKDGMALVQEGEGWSYGGWLTKVLVVVKAAYGW